MGLRVYSARLSNENIAVVDKSTNQLQFYKNDSYFPALKLNSTFDIVMLRDLLNDAYPPEVYSLDSDVRVR